MVVTLGQQYNVGERDQPLYHTVTLIAMLGHQTQQKQNTEQYVTKKGCNNILTIESYNNRGLGQQ